MPRLTRFIAVSAVAVGLGLTGCTAAPGSASTTPQPAPASATRTPSPSATTSVGPQPSAHPSATATDCPPSPAHFVMQAPGKGKTVALTFDDGPGPNDAEFAAILDKYRVHATFFETGAHMAAAPESVRLLAEHGNLIAVHSWDHRYPSQVRGGWTASYLKDQFGRTGAEITALTGQAACFVRPPGGFRTNVLATAATLDQTAVLWSIDSLDWRQPDHTTSAATAAIVARATAVGNSPHPIVLMHSAKASHEPDSQVSPYRGNTLAALPTVIEWYQQHGYRFVRLDGRS